MHSLIKRVSAVCVEPSVSPAAWPVLALAEKGFASVTVSRYSHFRETGYE